MRISAIILAAIGAVSLISQADATIVQNFEITVTQFYDPPFGPKTPTDAPPIGTKGFGTLTFDESQILYNGKPQTEMYPTTPLGYYTLKPTSYSLDFFNRRYTQIVDPGNIRAYTQFSFTRTDTGGYQLGYFIFGTRDETSVLRIDNRGFTYGNDTSGFFTAYGNVQLAPPEEVPEPTTIAGVPVALAIGWLFHQKRSRNRSKTIVLK